MATIVKARTMTVQPTQTEQLTKLRKQAQSAINFAGFHARKVNNPELVSRLGGDKKNTYDVYVVATPVDNIEVGDYIADTSPTNTPVEIISKGGRANTFEVRTICGDYYKADFGNNGMVDKFYLVEVATPDTKTVFGSTKTEILSNAMRIIGDKYDPAVLDILQSQGIDTTPIITPTVETVKSETEQLIDLLKKVLAPQENLVQQGETHFAEWVANNTTADTAGGTI